MKIQKRYWIVLGYVIIVILFYLALDPILDIIAENNNEEAILWLKWYYYPLPGIACITFIIYGFAIIITILSLYFYFLYRKKKKTELEKGFKITLILSILLIVYLLIGLLI